MTPEALIKLAGTGNTGTVEDAWMGLIEKSDLTVDELVSYAPVLSALNGKGHVTEAETLVWTTIETAQERWTKNEVLKLGCGLAMQLNKYDKLRKFVAELYLEIYSDREDIEALVEEAGIAGGRPARRALRTLDVCLEAEVGSYLAERHEQGAGIIKEVDTSVWEYQVNDGRRTKRFGAVELADNYQVADENALQVMMVFHQNELAKKIDDDPVWLISELCRQNNDKIDSDELELTLVPRLISESSWKKWWTRARTALKRRPQFKITGRSPYEILLVDESAHEEEFVAQFAKLVHPMERLTLLENRIRECKQHGVEPSPKSLNKCYELLVEGARQDTKRREPTLLISWLAASQAGEKAGVTDPDEGAIDILRKTDNAGKLMAAVDDNALMKLAHLKLIQARPDDWKAILAEQLPTMPTPVCDSAAAHLTEAGFTAEDFSSIVKRIIESPIENNDALLWLWDGPNKKIPIEIPSLTSLLGYIINTLEECQRNDQLPNGVARKISQRTRAVLSARKFERFVECLEVMERGVAMAIRTQIRRLNNLGKAVHIDLLNHINSKFPPVSQESTIKPWEEDDVLYVTPIGIARKQAEIDHHVNVKMKDNAKAIGDAAALGDLSENSEYKSALEERDLLRARLAQMNAEVAKAKVYGAEEVTTEEAGIGSIVIMRRVEDDKPFEMFILGPWEADLTRGRLNYQAPLAQSVLGKVVGDVINIDLDQARGDYEITAIKNGLIEEPELVLANQADNTGSS